MHLNCSDAKLRNETLDAPSSRAAVSAQMASSYITCLDVDTVEDTNESL